MPWHSMTYTDRIRMVLISWHSMTCVVAGWTTCSTIWTMGRGTGLWCWPVWWGWQVRLTSCPWCPQTWRKWVTAVIQQSQLTLLLLFFQRDGVRCFIALTAVCIFPSALCSGAMAALTQHHRLTQHMSEFTFVDAIPSTEEQQASFLRREKCTQLSVLSRVVFKCFRWHICDIYKSPSKLLLPSHSNHGFITLLLQWSQYFGSSHNLVSIFSCGWLFTAFTDQTDFCQFGLSFSSIDCILKSLYENREEKQPCSGITTDMLKLNLPGFLFRRPKRDTAALNHMMADMFTCLCQCLICVYGLPVVVVFLGGGNLFSYEYLLFACVNIQLSGLMMCLC